MVEEGAEATGTDEAVNEVRKEKKAKDTGGYEAIARQELRRARRLVTDGQPTPEATFSVSIATVLAILDLASAIREGKSEGVA